MGLHAWVALSVHACRFVQRLMDPPKALGAKQDESDSSEDELEDDHHHSGGPRRRSVRSLQDALVGTLFVARGGGLNVFCGSFDLQPMSYLICSPALGPGPFDYGDPYARPVQVFFFHMATAPDCY